VATGSSFDEHCEFGYNLPGFRCVQVQVITVSPRLDMSQFFGTRVTVVRRNYTFFLTMTTYLAVC